MTGPSSPGRSEGPHHSRLAAALFAQALFIMSKLCGVSIPDSLRAKLERFADDPGALKEIGWNHLEAQTESLLGEGIEGVHLYALNRLETVRRFSQLIQPV